MYADLVSDLELLLSYEFRTMRVLILPKTMTTRGMQPETY
jgi:hypothetical protein